MVKIGVVSTGAPWWKLWFTSRYGAAVRRAGGWPVWLRWTGDPARWQRWADTLDGFLFPGGGDPDPKYFGQRMLPQCGTPVPARDTMELGLLKRVLPTRKPVLGICRGEQMLNVAMGGTLLQDIPTQRPDAAAERHDDEAHRYAPSHPAKIAPGSFLAGLLQKNALLTNSVHHQAVDVPAPGLVVCAKSPKGIVEGVEGADMAADPGARFLLGVQWHPEATAETDPAQQAIFDAFIQRAKEEKTAALPV